ncbi:MAG: TRAP transporter large permease subunit [Betaproteobacteria bacterium]|nr:MAG: TRAP transporter large permease subunit [Betaproteobacteria bacterium]
MGRLISVLAVVLTCAAIALSADLFRMAGLSLYTEQVLAGLLAIATPLVFLHVSVRGERGRTGNVPWYDLAAAVIGFAASAYLAIRYASLSELTSKQPWDGLLAAGALIVLFLEGLRRTSGPALFYTTLAFIALAMFGGALPGEFAARSIPLPRLAYYLVWDSSAILGIAIKIIATVVVVYVFFGQVLLKAGGSTFFTGIAMALMGKYRGGPAKIAIVGSSLFGSISGNIVSNVMTVGTVTIGLHHGRVSPGAFLRSRLGRGHTRPPFLCRALHPGGP